LLQEFPYGEETTKRKLKMISEAEKCLKKIGFEQIRVRHHRDIVRIEVLSEDLEYLSKK